MILASARFDLGRIVATPGAIEELDRAKVNPMPLLRRHQNGDWGAVCGDDWQANELALLEPSRLLSVYILPTGVKVWIITEWDRSSTCLLLPEDY